MVVSSSSKSSKSLATPSPLPRKKPKPKKEVSSKANEQENDAMITIRTVVRPKYQLTLTPDELKEEITRILTADDPNVPRNISKFNYRDRCFKLDPPGHSDHMAVHASLDGCFLHIESHEYQKQEEREKKKEEDTANRLTLQKQSGILTSSLPEKHKNLFNYSERASQTIHHPLRSRGVSTEQPPVTQYSANVSVWQIYDSYVSDLVIMNMEHQDGGSGEKRKISFEDRMAVVQGETGTPKDIVHSEEMSKAIKVTERLINQNAQDEIYHDFKYFEDASDEYRAREGSLLPLWKFSTQRMKKGQQVTALCWNTYHDDLFAVGLGSYDFLQQGSGNVACYSLKNTSTPDFFLATESSVLCLDFNVRYPSLLAIGCYDGNVFVYNICSKSPNPIFSSSIRTGSHSDPIWEIHWDKEENGAELNFYSISSDGKVTSWILSRNELRMELVMNLSLGQSAKAEPEESSLVGFACGSCFDFHKKQSHVFVVGTEEGHIHKCSKSYSGQYLQTFTGHNMAVHSVQWNLFHERVFLSCSADWTVKLWDQNKKLPLMTYDLGSSVGDVCWSPYSSTVFAAVTNDSKVHVFDLAQNKSDPICSQKIVKRSRLTKVRFNSRDFVLIVGDERGTVHSLKLSPNLRKMDHPWVGPPRSADNEMNEVDRLETVLSTMETKV